MGFLSKLFKQTKQPEKKEYLVELERLLDEKNIPYYIDDFDDVALCYEDPFNRVVFRFRIDEGKLFYNNREIANTEALRLIEIKWKVDDAISKYMEEEEFSDFFDVQDFFSDMVETYGLNEKIVPLRDGKGLRLYYKIGATPTESDYSAGVEYVAKNEKGLFKAIPSGTQLNAHGTVLYILKNIYDEVPLFFKAGAYRPNEENRFADTVKAYLMDVSIVERLNDINNVEAQMTDTGRNNIIFVMFKNGAALEYLSPTKQNPSGRVVHIDLDEENTVEDNDKEHENVLKILKIPTMVKGKPDETKINERGFNKNDRTNR